MGLDGWIIHYLKDYGYDYDYGQDLCSFSHNLFGYFAHESDYGYE